MLADRAAPGYSAAAPAFAAWAPARASLRAATIVETARLANLSPVP